jgi:hypothetical protein
MLAAQPRHLAMRVRGLEPPRGSSAVWREVREGGGKWLGYAGLGLFRNRNTASLHEREASGRPRMKANPPARTARAVGPEPMARLSPLRVPPLPEAGSDRARLDHRPAGRSRSAARAALIAAMVWAFLNL